MKYFVVMLTLTLFVSNMLFAYGSVSLDRTAYPVPDVDPLELWNINDIIIDGTVIDKESIQDKNERDIFGYNIKVNEYFKGKQNPVIIYAKQLHVFPNFDLEKGDNALFYIRNTSELGYVVQAHSVKTFGNCDARSLIEIIPVLPNEEYSRSAPTMSESYFDQCVADYFTYDPDFFKGIVNEISPLKQAKHGIPSEMIRCYDDLTLLQKYDGSPACVKEQSIPKLVERNWGISDNWIKIANVNRVLNYESDTEKIISIHAFSEYKNPSLQEEIKQTWLEINLESIQDGSLQITLPRNLIDSKIEHTDDGFFVLLDGTETEYQETKTDSERILNFSIPAKTNIVEILGYGYYNPELSTFYNRIPLEPIVNENGTISENNKPYTWYNIKGIKQIYMVGEPISFTETIQGYANPCISTHYEILDRNTLESVWEYKIVYPCPFIKEPQQFKIIKIVPNENISSPILNHTGSYILRSYHSYSDEFTAIVFSVVDESIEERENEN